MAKQNLEKMSQTSEREVYTHEQAVNASIEYFKGDELAANVFVNKYALKDSQGNIYEKNPDDMHHRLAGELARIEKKYKNPIKEDEIYGLIKDFKFIVPQGGPMTGIGNKYQVASLSNCFVIGNEGASDSYGAILKIDQEQVQLMKRRGGVGHDLSHIRPKGSQVLNSALTSTGVVPFMERYSNSTREVAQDGRRGALMLSISIKHPDAEEFIDAKLEKGKVTGANVSVRIDDEFMKSVVSGKPYVQQFPVDSLNPSFTKEIDANKIWDKIVHNAWKSAEPGILFWDTITRESVADSYAKFGYKTVSTNPCGEIPLCPNDSCRLLAINLYNYVENPFTEKSEFNKPLFKKHVHYAQRLMDDIINLELEKIDAILDKVGDDPEEQEIKRTEKKLWENIRYKAEEGRRTGIGITAEGDMLAALNLKYGSKDAIDFAVEVHKTLAIEAYRSSVDLAEERGAFGIYDSKLEEENPFIQRIKNEDGELYKRMTEKGRRNIALLTIAPTGTTSLMTQTTSGIEPVFSPVYKRRRKVNPNDKDVNVAFVDEVGDSWEEYSVFHHKFVDWMQANGFDVTKKYNEKELDALIKKSPYYEATSEDVNWLNKVQMQGQVQKWVDHSISVTINLPKDVPEDLVGKLYVKAWESGCKGVTVYRDGSRSGVLISGKDEGGLEKGVKDFKRPEILEADVIRFNNKDEKWIAFVGLKDGKPYEIFTGLAEEDMFPLPKKITKGKIIKVKDKNQKSRYDFQYKDKYGYENTLGGLSHIFNSEFHNYAKFISAVMRYEMPVENVTRLISSLNLTNGEEENLNTWKAGVERALRKYIPNGAESKELCPDCLKKGIENKLIFQEGCVGCSCGFSKCG